MTCLPGGWEVNFMKHFGADRDICSGIDDYFLNLTLKYFI